MSTTTINGFLFKEDEDVASYPNLDFRLREILLPLFAWYFRHKFVTRFPTITSITSGQHSSATHAEFRAVDLRLDPMTLDEVEKFAEWINTYFSFGAQGFKVALVGKLDPKGQHNDHLHLQVPRPCKREGHISLLLTA